jgi:hypothetical protein
MLNFGKIPEGIDTTYKRKKGTKEDVVYTPTDVSKKILDILRPEV